jgi:hypothetical protein
MLDYEMSKLAPAITRSLYKKTLLHLRRGSGFYLATNLAIAEEVKSSHDFNLRLRLQQEKGLVLNFLGTILISRHPELF